MEQKTFNINIEMTVLVSLIYGNDVFKKYKHKLNVELFYLPLNQKIFNVLEDLYNKNYPIDEFIIREKIGSEFEAELLQILTVTPITQLEFYIDILTEYKIKRAVNKLILDINSSIETAQSAAELQANVMKLTEKLTTNNQIEILQINKIEDIEEKDIEFLSEDWLPIPKRTVSIITAPGGTGKSLLVLQLALRLILKNEISKAFLWLSEDPKEITKNRYSKICQNILNLTDMHDNDKIKNRIDISDSQTIQFLYDSQRKIEISEQFYIFKTMMHPYDLIVMDPLIAYYGADENNNAHARKFMQLFTDWANHENKTIIFIHHSTKNTTQSRGASAFVDAVRVVYELDHKKNKAGEIIESSSRTIKISKDNYGVNKIIKSFQFEREIIPYKNTKFVQKKTDEALPRVYEDF